jgi:ABC-type Na+ efflux pump permease subunit
MSWRKVWTVASTEFQNAVRTKAFLASVIMLPLIYALAIFIQMFASKADTRTRAFAVIDKTGELAPAVEAAAKGYNDNAVYEPGSSGAKRKQIAPRFEPTVVSQDGRNEQDVLVDLSDKVRSGELYAFVEIPSDVLDPARSGPAQGDTAAKLKYHTNTPTDMGLPRWIQGVVNSAVQQARFKSEGVDALKVAKAMTPVETDTLGLVDRQAVTPSTASGSPPKASVAQKVDFLRIFAPPIALVLVMFITVISTTPQLMQSVLEEKMSKISEVLLGSVSPFQLMLGKLVGNVGVALLLAFLYLGTAYGVAMKYGYGDVASPGLLCATVLFIFLGVMLFGSLFMAIGAACSDMKDAQSLMFPVMMLAMLPTFFWMVVLQQPSSPIAVGVSLFPPATPFLMLMRMALSPSPPVWQVILSVVLTSLTALLCVWASAKIFRTGLLMQGKAPSFAQLARWVMAK